jgi:DNA sulfur modification protein DndC
MLDHESILSEIRQLYLEDSTPWIIGFSGGKDSTTVLQMVFYALSKLPKDKLTKELHVLFNDTLVENPAIEGYVRKELAAIEKAGKSGLFEHNPGLFSVERVTPKLEDTFWVNLIGKGYPSPNRWFRWCTERLKINPTSEYILNTVNGSGKAIVVLGTRKAESGNRAASMKNYEKGNCLREHTLPNTYVYAPIAELSNHEVWAYLLQAPNPWGSNNRDLLSLYQNACSGGECPFVIETGARSCGKSRFGCWVCTVVDKDRAMENIIDNGQEWLEELLTFRNWLYDIRQQTSQHIPDDLDTHVKFGPFLLKTRREMLRRLLQMQDHLPIKLITQSELDRVRELLEKESAGNTELELRGFVFQLPNGKHLTTISDFNILLGSRKRLGAIHLQRAKLIETSDVSSSYLRSTRVLYHLTEE